MRSILLSILFTTSISLGKSINAQDENAMAEPVTFSNEEDRAIMMEQLGIDSLRPGKSGDPTSPISANYDESIANPYPQLLSASTSI